MEEKDMREILERLDKSNRQQVRFARLQSILAVLAALCFIGLVVVVGSIVPELMDFASEAESLLGQAEVVLTNLEDVTNELAQVEFTKMIDDVNGLVTSSQQGLEGTLEKINSIDIESLNEAIDGLAKVVEPLAKFFKVFG